MATRPDDITALLGRATRDSAMPPLVIISSDEPLLALKPRMRCGRKRAS